MPAISVIVPVYKVEKYLHECVDSILAQSYHDFELILVDDGSPDSCGAICDEYAVRDPRVRVIHQENGGLSAARNAGLDVARGEYVAFVDSDDLLHPDYLNFLIRGIMENQADISLVGFERFGDKKPSAEPVLYTVKAVKDGIGACYMLYTDEAVVYTIACGKLYKAALFSGIRYPVGYIHEDEATTYKLLFKADRVVEVDANLYGYRMNPTGIMGTAFSVKRYQAVAFFEERISFFEQKGMHELAELGRSGMPITLAKMFIMAKNAGVEGAVPKRYQMSVFQALRTIWKNSTDENFTYYLSLVNPKWLRPHAYIRKIKKILHIPCN